MWKFIHVLSALQYPKIVHNKFKENSENVCRKHVIQWRYYQCWDRICGFGPWISHPQSPKRLS
jgi:hypothetical protein